MLIQQFYCLEFRDLFFNSIQFEILREKNKEIIYFLSKVSISIKSALLYRTVVNFYSVSRFFCDRHLNFIFVAASDQDKCIKNHKLR